jgi:hypothetical protein
MGVGKIMVPRPLLFYSIHYYVSFNIPGMHTLAQRIRTNLNLYVPYHFVRDTFFFIEKNKMTYERHVLCMNVPYVYGIFFLKKLIKILSLRNNV